MQLIMKLTPILSERIKSSQMKLAVFSQSLRSSRYRTGIVSATKT